MEQIRHFVDNNLTNLHIPSVGIIDILEILIISFLIYQILVWIRNTKAWSLLKGIVVLLVIFLIAVILDMTTIVWIARNVFSLAIIAFIVVLQPELRRALETLGKRNYLASLIPWDLGKSEEGLFSDQTIREISKACTEMGRVKTGALIVVQQEDNLSEYENTGIAVDGLVSSQLLINIFEHNTPLHDGAVIIRGDRITSATCYLPLSDNMRLSKDLGTRHRAGVGISEATDSMTVIVSEETGKVSIAYRGELFRGLRTEEVEMKLQSIQHKPVEEKKNRLFMKRRNQI